MLQKPAALAGIDNLPDDQKTDGAGITVLQIEFDIFDQHDCIKTSRLTRLNDPERQINRPLYFKNVKRTVHATAVASVIVATDYGVAKQAELKFSGGTTKFREDADIVDETLRGVLRGLDDYRLKRGDIITISLQRDVTPVGQPNRRIKVPIDTHDAIRLMIREISEHLGVLVFIAAGNSGRDLSKLSYFVTDSSGLLKLYKRAYDNGRTNFDAFLVGSLAQSNSPSSYSNYGRCVDFFFPAARLQAACYHDSSESAALIGAKTMGFGRTSAATPAVAGVFANMQSYLIKTDRTPLDPCEVRKLIEKSLEHKLIEDCCGYSIRPDAKELIVAVDRFYDEICDS